MVVFATSGGSGFGNTVKTLKGSCNADILREGKVINSLDVEAEIKALIQ